MFTGLISDIGVVERIAPRAGGARLTIRPGRCPVDELAPGRERGLLRRLPHGGGAGRRAGVLRRRPRDPGPHHPRELARRHPGQPGAGAAPLRPAGRPPGAGARRRGRRGAGPRRPRGRGRGSPSRCRRRIAPLVAEKGSIAIDGVSLTVARGRARPVRGGAHPGDAGPHHAGRGGAGDPRSTWRPTSWRATWPGCASSPARPASRRVRLTGLGLRRRARVTRHAEHAVRADRGGPRGASGAGKMVILVDDEDRENEGDLCMAAEKVTPEAINFMAKHGRGLICLSLTEEKVRSLDLPLMVRTRAATPPASAPPSRSPSRPPAGVTTGISAKDRAHTILTAVARRTRARGPGPARPRLPAAGPAAAACWCAPARPRARSTWRAWPGSSRPASSARS